MLQDILSQARAGFAGQAHTELRAQCNRSRAVSLQNGTVTSNVRRENSGVSARVCQGGVYGFSSMAELSGSAAAAVLKAATDNAAFMDRHIQKNKPPVPPVGRGVVSEPEPVEDVPQKQYVEAARELDGYIAAKYPNLASRMVSARSDSVEKYLQVSEGWDAHTVSSRSLMVVRMVAETPAGTPVELYEPWCFRGGFAEHFSHPQRLFEKVDALYERLMEKREGVYAEAGLKTVVLGGDLCGMLAHEAVGHTVEADLVLGGSVAGPNLGKTVASELVSLTDFANTWNGEVLPQPVWVDDEGTPAKDAKIIENGVLVGYMNNRETAQHFGMTPWGNARAYSFSDEPLIRMRNTAVLPGKDKLADIIASVEDGYYLLDTNNGQADTTGEFMFGVCMGYEIKKGKLGRAILDTTITGVAFDMLKTVDMVSDTMHWSNAGTCGKKQPMAVAMGGPELRCKVMIGGR